MTDFSYQLYSSRNFPPLDQTFTMLSKLGYSQVEGYGGMFTPDTDLGALKAMLDANGLTMPTCHLGLDLLEQHPDHTVRLVDTFGVKAAFVPYLDAPLRPVSAEGWVAFGQRVAEAGKPLRDAGVRFGWHNHDFEFASVDGAFVLDLIMSGSDDLALELDLAWVQVGGQNPVDWVSKYADRIAAVHVKDIAPAGEAEDEDGWADVGHGVMDWPAITAALAGTRGVYHIMEHDNPNDHARFAQRSIEAARQF